MQSLLAEGHILRSACQQREPVPESCQQCLRMEQLHTCCRQFDGQGQPIQASTDLRDGSDIVPGQLKVGLNCLRALEEEHDRCILRAVLALGKLREVRHCKRWDREFLFTIDAQHSPAGHQHLELGTKHQQIGKLRCRIHHLLEVIQQQQEMLILQIRLQLL